MQHAAQLDVVIAIVLLECLRMPPRLLKGGRLGRISVQRFCAIVGARDHEIVLRALWVMESLGLLWFAPDSTLKATPKAVEWAQLPAIARMEATNNWFLNQHVRAWNHWLRARTRHETLLLQSTAPHNLPLAAARAVVRVRRQQVILNAAAIALHCGKLIHLLPCSQLVVIAPGTWALVPRIPAHGFSHRQLPTLRQALTGLLGSRMVNKLWGIDFAQSLRPRVQLKRHWVLEAESADDLAQCISNGAGRFVSGASLLCPRVAVVEGRALATLAGRLGVSVEPTDVKRMRRSPDAWLVAAGLVLQRSHADVWGVPFDVIADAMRGLPGFLREQAVDLARRMGEAMHKENDRRLLHGATPVRQTKQLSRLQHAIDQGRALRMRYQNPADGVPRVRDIEPLMLQRRGAHVYLLAWCSEAGDRRTFRLDRIVSMRLLPRRVIGRK